MDFPWNIHYPQVMGVPRSFLWKPPHVSHVPNLGSSAQRRSLFGGRGLDGSPAKQAPKGASHSCAEHGRGCRFHWCSYDCKYTTHIHAYVYIYIISLSIYIPSLSIYIDGLYIHNYIQYIYTLYILCIYIIYIYRWYMYIYTYLHMHCVNIYIFTCICNAYTIHHIH